MEEKRIIPLPDGKKLYGIWNATTGKEESIVILVHGWESGPTDRIMHNGAHFLKNHGYATYRVGFYFHEPDARRMDECSISLHAQDLNAVLAHFRPQYKKLYLVGHSLGTVVTALADCDKADAIVLWDPTVQEVLNDDPFDFIAYNESLDAYIVNSSVRFIQGTAMQDEFENYDETLSMPRLTPPVKCIYAQDGGNGEYDWDAQYALIPEPKEMVMTPHDHSFSKEGAEERLLAETLAFLTRR